MNFLPSGLFQDTRVRSIAFGGLAAVAFIGISLLAYVVASDLPPGWMIAIGIALTAGLIAGVSYLTKGQEILSADGGSGDAATDVTVNAMSQVEIERRKALENEAFIRDLESRVESLRESLSENPRARMPLQWAGVMNEIGTSLLELAVQEVALFGRRLMGKSNAHVKQAASSFRKALAECTRERAENDWAMMQFNLGRALLILSDREGLQAHIEATIQAFTAALDVITETHPELAEQARAGIAHAQKLLDQTVSEDTSRTVLDEF